MKGPALSEDLELRLHPLKRKKTGSSSVNHTKWNPRCLFHRRPHASWSVYLYGLEYLYVPGRSMLEFYPVMGF